MKSTFLSSMLQKRLHLAVKRLTLLVCLIFGSITAAQAAVTCTISTPRTDVTPLAPGNLSISGGSELPLGTVLYRFRWSSSPLIISCTGGVAGSTVPIQVIGNVFSAPRPLSTWNGSPYPGAVYSTSVSGVGVAIWNAGRPIVYGSPIVLATVNVPQNGTYTVSGTAVSIDSSLMKIGSIAPGNYTINGADLPTIGITIASADGSAIISPASKIQTSFTGQLTVTQPTCTTPDVNVSMGSYEIYKNFSGIGTATPWVDATLTLSNCPIFQGYYGGGNPVDVSPVNVPNPNNNQIGLVLTPLNTIINASNGIMAVSSMTSDNAAEGVGIQIGQGTSGSAPTPFNFNNEVKYTMATTGTSTITIPLSARYIQTSNTMIPGRGDGKMTFTINYY